VSSKLLYQLASAITAVDDIKNTIQDLILEQNEIEGRAYTQVYGTEFKELTDQADYYVVTDQGQLESWRYGSYGGEDRCHWTRSLHLLTEYPNANDGLFNDFVTKYTEEKNATENGRKADIEQRRAKLLAELQSLDTK
jgi:hypothetical protein